MKITIITQYFWPEHFKVNDLSLEAEEKGHDIEVCTNLPNYPLGKYYDGYSLRGPYFEKWQGIRIFRIPVIPRWRAGNLALALNYLSFLIISSFVFPFAYFFRHKTDIIFCWQTSPITSAIPAIIIKKLFKKPAVMWVQDLWPESLQATGVLNSPITLRILTRVCNWIYNQFDILFVQSKGFEKKLLERGITSPMSYLPNWAEDYYAPIPREQLKELDEALPKGFRVLYAGNIGVAQGFDVLIEAAEHLRQENIQWIVLGAGRDLERVRGLIHQKGLEDHFHFLGRCPPMDVPRYLALVDGVVMMLKKSPTLSITIPGRFQTYLACGVPVLASLDGEVAQILQESQAGLSSPAEDAAAFATNIKSLLSMSSQQRQMMGSKGYNYYQKHFAKEPLVRRCFHTLENLIS